MRLRIFDLAFNRLFWLVVFYQRQSGKPRVEILLFPGPRSIGQWCHLWKWEEIPAFNGASEVVAQTEGETP